MSEAGIQGFIAEGTTFEGDFQFQGALRVDGLLRGSVRWASALVVGPMGVVEADTVHVGSLTVGGELRGGRVEVDDRLEVGPTGTVVGQVVLARPALVVSPGARLEGDVRMQPA